MHQVRPHALRRVLLVLAVALLAAAGLRASPAAAGQAPTARHVPIRVMSFNIHHGEGPDGTFDLARTAATIRRSHADIVGLQEVDKHWSGRSEWRNEPAELAEMLDMHVVFGANLDLDPPEPGSPRRQYGNAILSKWPVLEWSNTLLPRYDGHEQRGLLYARISAHGVPVRMYTTHLQHNTPPEQMAQARAVVAQIGDPDEPAILTGDLNGKPRKPWVRTITDELTDTWTVAGNGPGYTFHADDPVKRIDYVLTGDGAVARHATVVSSDASDHLPVLVHLIATRSRR